MVSLQHHNHVDVLLLDTSTTDEAVSSTRSQVAVEITSEEIIFTMIWLLVYLDW